jgi:hypothetical protein
MPTPAVKATSLPVTIAVMIIPNAPNSVTSSSPSLPHSICQLM